MNLAAVWRELEESAPGTREGRMERRIFVDSPINLFATVQVRLRPGRNRRAVELVVAADVTRDLEPPAATRLVEVSTEPRSGEEVAIVLALEDPGAEDLFASLCADVAGSAAPATDEVTALRLYCGRFERWRRLLEGNARGLSAGRQRGLYGELLTLVDHLAPIVGVDEATLAWLGPDGAPRDFEVAGVGIETKATATNEPQVITIHGERQLDDRGLRALILVHHSLEPVRDGADTLPSLVDRARDRLSGHPASAVFEDRLLQSGYADVHAPFYRRTGYLVRDAAFFDVRPGFPRIVEADLADGIGRVTYALAVDACRHFRYDADPLTPLLDPDP